MLRDMDVSDSAPEANYGRYESMADEDIGNYDTLDEVGASSDIEESNTLYIFRHHPLHHQPSRQRRRRQQ